MSGELRIDEHLGTRVHIVAARQARPVTSAGDGCPFCPGGLEAPEPYDVRSFPNRWPALGPGMCEVVLYTPQHDATFASLGTTGARKVVDLWAERTDHLRSQPGVEYVAVFENRGAEIGATIAHPHGQIYAFDHVPSRPSRLISAGWEPDADPGERLVAANDHFVAYAQHASIHPVSLVIAPVIRMPDLPSLSADQRDSLASIMVSVLGSLDAVFGAPVPYMMWFMQKPSGSGGDGTWMHLEIVSPWRAPNLHRYVAAVEIATEEYFNPVDPADIAARLRSAGA